MSKNVNSQGKHANPKKIQQMMLTIIIIIGFLPLNINTALAASVSLGVTPIMRAPGIDIDAFAVEAMIIEYLKPREISQYDLFGTTENVLPDGGTDSAKSATLIDDILRIYGLPASRQSVTNSVSLQFTIMNAINAGLPLALIGDSRQVVVDGYDNDSGFSVHVLNPETGQAAWSSISGIELISPSFTIREIVTLYSSVTINTGDYGTLTYLTVENSLTGGNPPSNPVLREAIKSSAPYVTSSETVYIVNHGTGASNIGLYLVLLNPEQTGDPKFLEDVFSLWWIYGSSDYTTFPVLPLDNSGYVDVSNLKNDIRNLALINMLLPSEASGQSYAKLDLETINDVIDDHAHYWMYEDPFED